MAKKQLLGLGVVALLATPFFEISHEPEHRPRKRKPVPVGPTNKRKNVKLRRKQRHKS